jgi:SWI/SNF-related matrix-associated actin-dependent regulator of chromatin subfamily A3
MRYFSYEHDITGTRTADTPIETLGGILADDMGLGKTLTVLSTILRTTKMSKSFVEENNEIITAPEGNGHGTHQILSRATLVIVPSSRV